METSRHWRWLGRLSTLLAALYLLDRLLKSAAVVHFFRRPAPAPPPAWPSVSLLQPISRGTSDLPGVLAARAVLNYAGTLHHLLICDAADATTQAVVHAWAQRQPPGSTQVIVVPAPPDPSAHSTVAPKIEKLNAALPHATGDVLCFLDDDVAPRPDAVAKLVPHLLQPGVGAAFGLACYTNWRNPWSSLMSGFVDANALLSYIPLAYLTEPYTITGHFFALRREVFAAAGGLEGLAARLDDDHELARRVRRLGLRCVQTPVVYDVDNDLGTFDAYANQMRRWFIIPRVTMAPHLTRREQLVTLAGSLGPLLFPVLALLALCDRGGRGPAALATGAFGAAYLLGERYSQGRTPLHRWPLVLLAALVAPLQALAALGGGSTFVWRGQRVRLQPDGRVTTVDLAHQHDEQA